MSTAAKATATSAEKLIYSLFFLSGIPALIDQITWQRALFRIFGVNSESVTIIVTAFMLGLGLGSLAGGFLSRQRRLLLMPTVAAIELAIGLFGLASLKLFDAAGMWLLGLSLPAIAAAVFGLILLPTLLMGMTLPLLVAYFAPRLGHAGSSMGMLYYVNTLGAGFACLLCAAVLFPFGGMALAVKVGAAINIVIALTAWLAYRRDRSLGTPRLGTETTASPHTPVQARNFFLLLALAGLGGFVSLSYEILFFRIMTYITGSSAPAFAVTLGVFLVALASGSRMAGEASRSLSPTHLKQRALHLMFMALAGGFAFLPLLNGVGVTHIPDALLVAIALLVIFFITRCWGFLLPCLTELAVRPDSNAGLHTSFVYAANILGAAAGGILTGFVLTDRLALPDLASALLASGFVCAFIFYLWSQPAPHPIRAWILPLLLFITAPFAQRALTSDLLDHMLSRPTSAKIIESVENRHGLITVDADRTVYGNGAYDGKFSTDLMHDTNGIVRAYALSLFHSNPRDVLMIGLASGSWAQVVANNPAVEHLTIVEINPGYQHIIGHHPETASLLTNPKVRFVVDDGRRWLRWNKDRRFDAIIINTTFHFRSNATNLLSREFLELEAQHLNQGGIISYNTTQSARVQKTGCSVLPYGTRFLGQIILSPSPLIPDFERWHQTLAAYSIDGKPVFNQEQPEHRARLEAFKQLAHNPENLAEIYGNTILEDCAAILARTTDLPLVTDDNMGTEWRSYGFVGQQ